MRPMLKSTICGWKTTKIDEKPEILKYELILNASSFTVMITINF